MFFVSSMIYRRISEEVLAERMLLPALRRSAVCYSEEGFPLLIKRRGYRRQGGQLRVYLSSLCQDELKRNRN